VLAQVDLERLKKHMAETIEKAKQEDPRLLRAEIQRLRAELAKKPASVPAPVKTVKAEPVFKDRIVKVPALKSGEIKKLRKIVDRVEEMKFGLGWSSQSLESARHIISQAIGKSVDAVERVKRGAPCFALWPPRRASAFASSVITEAQRSLRRHLRTGWEVNLLAGERKMLEVLAQFHPGSRTKSQLGRLAGYTPSGGTVRDVPQHASEERSHQRGCPRGNVRITEAGSTGSWESALLAAATTEELHGDVA
jgi:hypothetical protein